MKNEDVIFYPVQLYSKVTDEVGMFDSFEDLQLVGRFLDGFVVVGLEANLKANSQ